MNSKILITFNNELHFLFTFCNNIGLSTQLQIARVIPNPRWAY